MDLTQSILSYGLRSTATPTSTNVFNDVEIGVAQTQERFADADVIYSLRAVMAGSASSLSISQFYGTCTATTFVTGTAQVETATAAGTITASGNASVTVTSSVLTGSPLTISVPVILGDTASVWAGKARTALAANTAIAALFSVGGTTTGISLTKSSATIGGLSIYSANDATLNIALANGTCTGITAAPTSANTTAGVATSGVKLYDGDGKDFEGNALPLMSTLYATLLSCTAGTIKFGNTESTSGSNLIAIGKMLQSSDLGAETAGESFLFTEPPVAPDATEFTFTVLGKS
jgi:hypothetical protein